MPTPVALPQERAGRPATADLAQRRRGMAAALASRRVEPPPRQISLAGVRALRFEPTRTPRGTVLHLHGGGFRLGCPEAASAYAAALAAACDVAVICPAYRLAPEHPFPAGLLDADAVLGELQAADAGPLILSGDSAGAGLAASLTLLSRGRRAAPAALVLHSPWLDLTLASATYDAHADKDRLFSRQAAEQAAESYLQGHRPHDPLASPLFADLAGFPPTLISAGEEEVLVQDARGFYAALRSAGVEAALIVQPGMEHVAVTRSLDLPGADEIFEATVAFIQRRTGRNPA